MSLKSHHLTKFQSEFTMRAETKKLDLECQGYLSSLEQMGILTAASRELIIDRVMALETDEISIEQLRWLCLIVLYNISESDIPIQLVGRCHYGLFFCSYTLMVTFT